MKTLDETYWQIFCSDRMPMNLKQLRKIRRENPPMSNRGYKRFKREMENDSSEAAMI